MTSINSLLLLLLLVWCRSSREKTRRSLQNVTRLPDFLPDASDPIACRRASVRAMNKTRHRPWTVRHHRRRERRTQMMDGSGSMTRYLAASHLFMTSVLIRGIWFLKVLIMITCTWSSVSLGLGTKVCLSDGLNRESSRCDGGRLFTSGLLFMISCEVRTWCQQSVWTLRLFIFGKFEKPFDYFRSHQNLWKVFL